MPFSFLRSGPFIISLVALGLSVARADEPARPEFRNVSRGVTLGADANTGGFGTGANGSIGLETTGIKSFSDRKLVFQWDVAGAAKAGYSAAPVVGGALKLESELGYRLPVSRGTCWDPYASVSGKLDVQAMGIPQMSITDNLVYNLDRIGGSDAVAAARASLGASCLDAEKSLMFNAFIQRALRSPDSFFAGGPFTEVGVHAQLDLPQDLSLMLEALYGKSGQNTDTFVGSASEGTYRELVARFRKVFGSGYWTSLDAKVADGTKTSFYGNGTSYSDKVPTSAAVTVNVGIPIE